MKKHFWILTSLSLALLFLFAAINAPCFADEDKKEPEQNQTKEKSDQPEKTYLLRYRFEPKETLRWEVVLRGRNQTTVSGTTKVLETVSKSTKIWKVLKVNRNGSAIFENQVEDVDMWQKMTDCKEVRYNSKNDKEPPHGFEVTAERIGKPLARITLDPLGEVQDRVDLVKTAENDQNDEKQITIPLPKEAIPVGHTWRVPQDIYVPLETGQTKKVVVHQSFTLEGVKNDIATIKFSTQILTPVRNPAIEAKLVDHYRRGTIRFDIPSGRIVSQQMDLDKQVIGFRGPDSRIHYLTRFTERLQTLK